MDNRYGDDYNGSYIPRGPPSYSESNPGQVNSYSGSIPIVPPSNYSGSIPRSFDHNEKDFDENKSYQSKDMNRYPRDNRGQYASYNVGNVRDSDHDSRSNRPDNDRYYNDRDRQPAEPLPSRSPYNDDRHVEHDDRYGRDSYDDRGSYRRDPHYEDRTRDPYYDERSDSYHERAAQYRDNRPYDERDSGSNRDKPDARYDDKPDARYDDKPDARYDDKPMPRAGGGRDYPQYDEYDGKRPQDNGFNPRSDLDEVRLDEREEDIRYTAETGNVELAYSPPEVKAKKKPVLQKLKPNALKEKWKQKPSGERRKYCALCIFLVLAAICIIVVPTAIYVRLWHKLTWQDIRELQVRPRDIKWGQQGHYVYYRDFSNNVIRVDLTKENAKRQEIIFKFETWNKVGYDDFDVTGPGTMLILVKNNGTSLLHMNFVDLYKYKIGDTNNQPQMFQTNVVHWQIVRHETENRIVFVQQDISTHAYNIRLHEMGPALKTLKEIGDATTKPTLLRGVLTYIYSEEFFGRSSKGFWVSPKGDYIVFMETDVSFVRTVSVQAPDSADRSITYNYPFVGGKNPMVRLRLYDVIRGRMIMGADEALNPAGKQDKHWVTAVSFPNSQKLLIEFMNRQQTRATTEECTLNLSPTCEDLAILRRTSFLGWLPRYPAAAFPAQPSLDTQQYYVLRPRVDKQFNFTHLHKYETTNDPNKKISLTNGEFAVTELIGNDHTRQQVLYVRTEELNMNYKKSSSTRKRMVYMYHATNGTHTCISCMEPKYSCDVATAYIDVTRHWYQLECLGSEVPYKRIKSFADYNWNVYNDDNQNIQYQDPSIQAQLLQKRSPWVQYTQTELDKNTKIYVAVKKIFPLYYVKHANILKYPLVVWVDPYPDGNMATMKYKLGLAQWFATAKDCVVIYMDVRGTPGRGLSFHHWPYKDLMKIVDKAEQAIKDIKMYWHVNDNKVAIMGEKLGGWLALKMMQRRPEWFKAALAINPILSFSTFLSAYTERYLELYTINKAKYIAANMNLGNFTSDIKAKTAIYYDPTNYEVPNTYANIKLYLDKETGKDGYVDYSGFNMYNIWQIVQDLKLTFVSDDLFLNIGMHITGFLEESPHNIF